MISDGCLAYEFTEKTKPVDVHPIDVARSLSALTFRLTQAHASAPASTNSHPRLSISFKNGDRFRLRV